MQTIGRVFITALAIGLAPLAANAQSTIQAEAEVMRLEQAWRTARIEGDIAFLERFYGEELRIQGMDGAVVERDDDIALFAAGDIKPEFIRPKDVRITVYGNTAVVTGVDDLRGTYRGNLGEMSLRFTDVLVLRDGHWQLVAHQTTQVR